VVTFKNKVYAEVMLKEINTGTILSQSFQSSTVKNINDAADNLLAPLIVKSFG